jgi:hypothetical protein
MNLCDQKHCQQRTGDASWYGGQNFGALNQRAAYQTWADKFCIESEIRSKCAGAVTDCAKLFFAARLADIDQPLLDACLPSRLANLPAVDHQIFHEQSG